MTFTGLWESLLPLGRDERTGGYRRYSWTEADRQCRAWFTAAARDRNLAVTPDANGNLRARWHPAPANGEDSGRMLFVRNPTGVSHAPAEHADRADCELGVTALAAVLEDLACQ
jgi:hypothetical protein